MQIIVDSFQATYLYKLSYESGRGIISGKLVMKILTTELFIQRTQFIFVTLVLPHTEILNDTIWNKTKHSKVYG